MNKVTLTVASSTPTENGNFANKLVGQGVMIETEFGQVEGTKPTYYMFTKTKNDEKKEANLDLDLFDLVKKEFDFTDDSGKDQTAVLSYLYPKRG